MFFRRKKQSKDELKLLHQPVMGKDGNFYVEEGQEYDKNQYETDSDYDDEEVDDEDDSESEEEEIDEEEEHVDNNVEGISSNGGVKSDNLQKVEDIERYDEELIPWDDSADDDDDDDDEKKEIDAKIGDQGDEENGIKEANINNEQHQHQNNTDQSGNAMNEPIQPSTNTYEYGDEKVALIPKETMTETIANKSQNDDLEEEEEVVVVGGEREGEEHQQTPVTSLHEKKSLLALAAQHDRVDIIKTILQSTSHQQQGTDSSFNNSNDSYQLIQLLLNNKIVGIDNRFTQDDMDDVFLPPLHIAVASSSTNAASCLLRMGSDPSIRTIIPDEWEGPTWDDPSDSSPKKKKDELIQHWKKLNGLSAWEVAFGVSSSTSNRKVQATNSTNESSNNGKNKNDEKRSSWFGGWSSSSTITKTASFDIAPSKLEGIKHAFTAEALRAIGSDEVHRLRELIQSGLDSPSSPKNNNNGQDDSRGSSSTRGVEIGGKDLLSWCIEMNAEKCSTMLKEIYAESSNSTKDESKKKNEEEQVDKQKQVDNNKNRTKQTKQEFIAVVDNREVSEEHLLALKIKLEENKVLAGSLSLVLDNLAEEVSLTQGLLYQQGGDSSNTALISQVRSLKESRGDIEMDISEWEGRLADRIVELRMVISWWKHKGGSENDFIEIFDNGGNRSISDALASEMTIAPPTNSNEVHDHQSLRNKIMEMKAQVSLIEGKVKKLRSSIADLAEENSRNLIEVTKMGLGGAVNLARTLKEEVKEREHILQNLKQREAACRTRICMIRSQLEKAAAEAPIANNVDSESNEVEMERVNTASESHDTSIVPDNNQDVSENDAEEEDVIYYDEEEDCIIEYVDDSDGSDVEYEYYSDDEEEIPLSEAIRTGKSTALALHEEPHVFLSFKIWELLLRVIGLSKQAIKETVKSTGLDDIGNLPRAMIV